MHNSKLIQVFKALNITQKRQFKKWIESPIHNTNKDATKLFNLLYSKRKLTSSSLEKHKIFQALYPSKEYNDNRLRHVIYTALGILENYVRYSLSIEDVFYNKISLAKAYKQMHLPKYAEQSLLQLKKDQSSTNIKNSTFFLQNYELEQELFTLAGTQKRTESSNLQEITAPFTSFFILNTLKYACIGQTHSNLRKKAYEIPLLKAVLEEVKGGNYQELDAIMIYYLSYWALKKENAEEHFIELKKYLFAEKPVLNRAETKDLYLTALNYCIKKLNSGDEEYVREAFEIYKMGLRQKILLEEQTLSRFAFKNIVALGLRAKEFAWIEQFIETYKSYLNIQYRDSYTHYNTSKLFFEKGNYSKAMDLLIQVEYDDIFLNLDAKIMLLKIYFANNNSDALLSLIDSMKVYLGRKSKEVLSYHQANYKNILRFTHKLATINPYDNDSKVALKKEIQEVKPLTEKGWLLDSLSSL